MKKRLARIPLDLREKKSERRAKRLSSEKHEYYSRSQGRGGYGAYL